VRNGTPRLTLREKKNAAVREAGQALQSELLELPVLGDLQPA
jgi:hypothetical protein